MKIWIYCILAISLISTEGFCDSWQNPEAICSSPDAIFCSGFEEQNWRSIWDDYDGNPDPWNKVFTQAGPLNYQNNHVMRFRVPAGNGGTDLVKLLPSQHQKLFARWYQYWEPGYDFSARCHGGGLHAGDRNLLGHSNDRPLGNDWFTTWLEPTNGRLNLYSYYRGMYQDCANPVGSCWGDHFPCWMDEGQSYCTKAEHRETELPPSMESGKWYCLETMLDGGTAVNNGQSANGETNFWINGKPYGPWKQLWFRTDSNLKISVLWLNLYHHEGHSVEGVLIDNVVVSKDRIGCLESGDNIAPSAPLNLRNE